MGVDTGTVRWIESSVTHHNQRLSANPKFIGYQRFGIAVHIFEFNNSVNGVSCVAFGLADRSHSIQRCLFCSINQRARIEW